MLQCVCIGISSLANNTPHTSAKDAIGWVAGTQHATEHQPSLTAASRPDTMAEMAGIGLGIKSIYAQHGRYDLQQNQQVLYVKDCMCSISKALRD